MRCALVTATSLLLLATVSAAVGADEPSPPGPGDVPAPYGLEQPVPGHPVPPVDGMSRPPYPYAVPSRIYLEKARYEEGYLLRVHSTGVKAEDIQVQADRGRLRLRVERSRQGEWQSEQPYRHSSVSSRSSIRRSVRLPYDADGSRLTTSVENGVLEIRIPARMPPGS